VKLTMSKVHHSRLLIVLATLAAWPAGAPAFAELAIHIHADKAMFQVLMSPGRVGADSFVLQLMDGDGSLLKAKEATLTLSPPKRGIEPLQRKATLGADGYWHVRDVPIPYPGRWHVRIDAVTTDLDKITLEHDLEVPAR
jgi:copper transport protein